jgi:hypothetical protein
VTTITGHGQGNAQNCGEFCPKIHSMSVNGKNYTNRVWRDNCATTVNPNQQGTWQYSRAGWCPGDKVYPWVQDISDALLGSDAVISYNVENFENTCRPGVPDCRGCVFGTACDYDGGLHTEPRFLVSSYIVYMK